MQRKCGTCYYWSEMIAKADHAGVSAICLNQSVGRHGDYTVDGYVCPGWQRNVDGAIDDPRRQAAEG